MSLSAGNLLSATISASNTLAQEIRAERAAESSARGVRQPEQDFSFDPLSSCIGSTLRSIRPESAEFQQGQGSIEQRVPEKP